MATYQFNIAGSGIYVPKRCVSAAELAAKCNLSESGLKDRFGIIERHWAEGADETSSSMGAKAAQAALDEAGWDGSTLDVIIGACGVMEQPIPGTSVLIQHRLGLGNSGVAAFDMNATCLSFIMALDRVLAGFALGEWQRALIVSADIASAALDFAQTETSAFFGDGAAAFVFEANGPHLRLAHRFKTYGEAYGACQIEAGGTKLRPHDDLRGFLAKTRFSMNGPALFKATSRVYPGFLCDLIAAAGMTAEELDLIIPHQASATALEHLKRSLPNGHAKTIDIYAHFGNQIATSLPTALHHARTKGLLKTGSTSLLIGSSAGISLGGAMIRW